MPDVYCWDYPFPLLSLPAFNVEKTIKALVSYENAMRDGIALYVFFPGVWKRWCPSLAWDHKVTASSRISSTTKNTGSPMFKSFMDGFYPDSQQERYFDGDCSKPPPPMSQTHFTMGRMIYTLLWEPLRRLLWNNWKPFSLMSICSVYQRMVWQRGYRFPSYFVLRQGWRPRLQLSHLIQLQRMDLLFQNYPGSVSWIWKTVLRFPPAMLPPSHRSQETHLFSGRR